MVGLVDSSSDSCPTTFLNSNIKWEQGRAKVVHSAATDQDQIPKPTKEPSESQEGRN